MYKIKRKSILTVTPELRMDLKSENGSVRVSRLFKLFHFILFYFYFYFICKVFVLFCLFLSRET